VRKFWLILIAALLIASCAPRYDAALLTSIEGRWMCDVQRYTFESQQDIQAELETRLSGNGVSADQYRAFKDDLTKQQNLRDEVRAVYDQQCGA
jgi:uncharacterized lipoprotein YmbA